MLAEQLLCSDGHQELTGNFQKLYQHVKEHFTAEEEIMKKLNYHGYNSHINEHNLMLESLADVDRRINRQQWTQQDIEAFMDKWGSHIIHSDMAFNDYLKAQQPEPLASKQVLHTFLLPEASV